MTDPNGFTHAYAYDIVGRLVRESYDRLGNGVIEASTKSYDLEGRAIGQGMAKLVSGAWSQAGLDVASTQYNAFGEAVAIGVNGVVSQHSDYDAAGRLWRTTAGDGTWKYFMYDANGNQTLMVASAGGDIVNKTLDQVLDLWGADRSKIAIDYVAGVVSTITRYDARNQAIEVREPQRERAAGVRDNLLTSRAYNAFGEVTSETNAGGAAISYAYNTMGRQTKIESPYAQITAANGTTSSQRPTEYRYYDASGRLVASRDANGNLTQLTLLAGTGYGGSQALVTDVKTADGAIVHTGYDVHGDARVSVDQIGRTTTQSFDSMGRVIQVNAPSGSASYNTPSGWVTHYNYGLVDYYQYDGLGQRIRRYNNQLGVGNAESTIFDAQGRITQQTAMGGDVTSYAYAWNSAVATSGMGTFGGWEKTTTYANFKTTLDISDVFGRSVSSTDMSGGVTGYTYDVAGRVTRRSGGIGLNYTYFNTGRVDTIAADTYAPTSSQERAELYFDRYKDVRAGAQKDYESLRSINGSGDYDGDSDNDVYDHAFWHYGGFGIGEGRLAPWAITVTRHTSYKYDIVGNVTDEFYAEDNSGTTNFNVFTNSHATFDGLGRMMSWSEAGSGVTPAASVDYKYDAAGNLRNTDAYYYELDQNGAASGSAKQQNYWYRYDALNRIVTTKGTQDAITGLTIRGAAGTDIYYDNAGQRVRTETAFDTEGQENIGSDPMTGEPIWAPTVFHQIRREDYTYDGAGRLFEVYVETHLDGAWPSPAVLRGRHAYDLMGRMTLQQEFSDDGQYIIYQHQVTLNAKSQMVSEQTNYLNMVAGAPAGGDIITATYTYGSGTGYALGSVVSVTSDTSHNLVHQKSSWIDYTYNYTQGAQVASLTMNPDTGQGWLKYTTYNYLTYGGQAQLDTAYIIEGYNHTVSYVNDLAGQVVVRDDIAPSNQTTGDPFEVSYRMAGRSLGYTGNNGSLDMDYGASIGSRFNSPTGNNFRFNHAQAAADFSQGIDPINSFYQGSAAGAYEVRAGDTLGSIAAGLWGDAGLWWKLAEANGLSGQGGLVVGQRLTIPAGVMRATQSAGTFNPYDPADAMGTTSPGGGPRPVPSKHGGCGVIGTIIMVVIAVVVTWVSAGTASSIWGGVS